ncbi:MAG: CD225/dispanin family protein [Candidatus Sulfotelmatobacter sp.]|jgi:hypothetical protein
MFCPQCGASTPDNAVVCMQCGRNLQAAPPPPLQATPYQGAPLQAPGVILPPGATVPNYLVFAILTTVFCCLPAGIPAIVFAAQVNGKLQAGDLAGAQQASKNAKLWCLISLGLGLAVVVIWGLLVLAGVLTGISHQN